MNTTEKSYFEGGLNQTSQNFCANLLFGMDRAEAENEITTSAWQGVVAGQIPRTQEQAEWLDDYANGAASSASRDIEAMITAAKAEPLKFLAALCDSNLKGLPISLELACYLSGDWDYEEDYKEIQESVYVLPDLDDAEYVWFDRKDLDDWIEAERAKWSKWVLEFLGE